MKKASNPHQTKLVQAVDLQNKGDNKKATALFLQVLNSHPENIVALYSLAAIESNVGNATAALNYATRAVRASPSFAEARLARSVILYKLGRFDEALVEADKTLELQPNMEAALAHKVAIATAKTSGLTVTPAIAGQSAELNTKALQLQDQGKLNEAERLFISVLEKYPDDFVALYSLGVIAGRSGRSDEALRWLTLAAETSPDNAMAHYALATTLQGLALFEQALAAFDRALEINPEYMDAYNNKATLLHSMNRHLEALQTMEQALSISPQDQKSLGNKGYILTEFKQNALAADVFKHLLTINPEYEYAEGLHAFARLHSCDWTDFDVNKQRIIEGVRAGKKVCNPFALMAITDDAKDHLKCAETFGEQRFPAAKEPLWRGEVYRHRKKRVAFISADFREHPVGYLLIGLIENFDKTQFETFGISLALRDGSELYSRYRNGFDHYLDCADKASHEVARLIRAMEIDIMIDLSGYTSGSRLDILAHRPAPVQATYLGFPGGLNLPYIDYLIADKVTVPEEHQPHYREKLLYLPHCYLPRDTGVKLAPTTPPRSKFGLPNDGLVLCSFNHDYKINPPMFEAWMDLLRENPGSVLWLMKLNDDARQNLEKTTNHFGIDPKRLVFATRVPRVEDHLARYRHADVFLDTFPYNGHTTASDALLAGVPVVTLTGNGFASRVATSLLHDMGKSSWCVNSIDQYKQKAKDHLQGKDRDLAGKEQRESMPWPITEETQVQAFCHALSQI
ncbi:MAG: tetratricopeptide repeat protein [Oxalobacteraceae bacterium]|nr:tetratricopeptide repeat protein [Oxalobacteraceae bacterium]